MINSLLWWIILREDRASQLMRMKVESATVGTKGKPLVTVNQLTRLL